MAAMAAGIGIGGGGIIREIRREANQAGDDVGRRDQEGSGRRNHGRRHQAWRLNRQWQINQASGRAIKQNRKKYRASKKAWRKIIGENDAKHQRQMKSAK